jgi:O-antigen ligase
VFALAWTLFAFGGYYAWTQWPAAAALTLALLAARPRVAARPYRLLDLSLLAGVTYVFIQTIPFPVAWRDLLSPHVRAVDGVIRFGSDPHRALSLDPPATLKAAVVTVFLLGMFWICRETFARHGLRRLVRVVAWSGLLVSIVAIVCRAIDPKLLYATWDPGPSAAPYGPFIDRNHMGSWLVMAAPLIAGYLVARLARGEPRTLAAKLDATTLWLAAAVAAMYAASIMSFSRSTFIGMAAALVTGGLLATKRRGRGGAVWLVAIVIAAAAIAAAMPRTADLVMRFEDPREKPEWSRLQIWHDTLPIVHDFALTGVGVGGYRNAMVVYQQADRRLFFNQAHNQLLQLITEGGLILAVPMLSALIAFAILAGRRLRADHSPTFWIRAGAVAGLAGIFVQSLWEIGLRMPANTLLFAALAAAAIHESPNTR